MSPARIICELQVGHRGWDRGAVADEDHAEAPSCAAAARSISHTRSPSVGAISCDGYRAGSRGPVSTCASAAAFSAPATRNRTWRAALIAGAVSVSRHAVPWTSGEVTWLATTQRVVVVASATAGLY